jgi:1-pyrroline-5-carboxylate dehydrogenase
MAQGIYHVPGVPVATNEPVLEYRPGSPERAALKAAIKEMKAVEMDIPMFIGGKEIRTGKTKAIRPPHELKHILGYFHAGGDEETKMAIEAALAAKKGWADLSWDSRAAIFLKAAELISGPYRAKINAATMLCQSKNAFQAEIDSACELADFLRFNVQFMTEIYMDQPKSSKGVWNKTQYRPLEGFVYALTPFNFTAIAGNLPSSPALMGNTVVWKCSNSQVYSANVIMEIFREAGLPDGVINLVFTPGASTFKVISDHPEFAGIHYTGSSAVFHNVWKSVANNVANYRSFPRIVGETGGKDFVMVHKSACAKEVATALSRGAFEYQGQKCSAASRAYIPGNLWDKVKAYLIEDISSFKMGTVEDFSNFVNAVIDEASFDKLASFIDRAKEDADAEIIIGGGYDKTEGYFIQPTVILTTNPKYITMEEELFGPVLTIYVYDAEKYEETMEILDQTSPYALTGSIFAKDRKAIELALVKLVNAAGNFYINDKPTGAVVGQQPFGGARASGTNDKAGSALNLLRWVSARTIKETLLTPTDYRYPFLAE